MYNYRAFKTYLSILFFSLILGIYLFEIYLNSTSVNRETNVERNSSILKKEKKIEYDLRSKYEIYKSMKLNDKNITVSTSPRVFNDPTKKIHFLSGISKSKTIDCNENGYFSIYKSDRYGFNNPDREWNYSEIDYILVGDSYTHGACVNRPNDIASILRNLSKKRVLNLGYKANGPLSMYASLKEYKPEKIKKIIWMYYEGNDLQDLNEELKIEFLKEYIVNENYLQNLKQKQDYIDAQSRRILIKSINAWDNAREQAIKNSKVKYKILKFIRLDKSKKFLKSIVKSKNNQVPMREFKMILKYTKEIAENKNAQLYFVYLPQFERYKSTIRKNNHSQVKEIVNSLNINFIDVDKEVFQKEKEPLKLFPFEDWGHYNVEGYRKIGELLFREIEKDSYKNSK